jgi:acetoin utilization protein AcuB
MKRIADVMTPQPWTVQLDDSLAIARRMIAERDIHHLPVLDRGEVVGMVTERDLAHAANRLGTVADVMVSAHPVAIDAPIADVLDTMMTRGLDAVVVTSNAGVEGIYTASDAVRMLLETLRRRRAA